MVVDPYAKVILSRRCYGQLGPDLAFGSTAASGSGSSPILGLARTWPQAAGVLPSGEEDDVFDWEGDVPLNTPMSELVIYECHVRGFTQHTSSGVSSPGELLRVIQNP